VTWSGIRYTGYCLLVIDSEPGWSGGTSTLRIRGLDEAGDLIDYIEPETIAGRDSTPGRAERPPAVPPTASPVGADST
jgi:hypothetical protein